MDMTDRSDDVVEAPQKMRFHTRKWVKPEDLNPNGTLFGGRLLSWIDEEAAIYAICQLGHTRVVTKYMSEINFISSARTGDVIELGIIATAFGRTSLTLRCEVRNKVSRESILTIERLVFVGLDEAGNPCPHGKTKISYGSDIEREKVPEHREKTTLVQPLAAPALSPHQRIYSLEDPIEHRIDNVVQVSLPSIKPSVREHLPAGESPAVGLGEAYLG